MTINAAGFTRIQSHRGYVQVGKTTSLRTQACGHLFRHNNRGERRGPDDQHRIAGFLHQSDSQQTIDNLPINGRRWSDLTLLTPGVVADSNGFGLLSVRGISPLLNNVQIDGADDNQAYFSEERGRTREGYSTPMVAVQEFQVNTGVYSAEYGRAARRRHQLRHQERNQPAPRRALLLRPRQRLGRQEPVYQADHLRRRHRHNHHHPIQAEGLAQAVGLRRRRPDHQGQALLVLYLRSISAELPRHRRAFQPRSVFPGPRCGAYPHPIPARPSSPRAGKTQPTNPVDAQACVLQARLGLATYADAVNALQHRSGRDHHRPRPGLSHRKSNHQHAQDRLADQRKEPCQLHLQPSRLALARRRADPGDQQLQRRWLWQ